jgi:uncharacterized phage protein gp47/JayE
MGSYAPPSISAAGLTIPSYTQILNYLIAQYQAIYGQSVYLGVDSADYQEISLFASMAADVLKTAQLTWNNQSPQTAVGAGLDSIIKLNGLQRLIASYSTVVLTITGTPGTVITNGIVQDSIYGYNWNLPASVTIPNTGTITAVALCQQIGAVAILAGQISTSGIVTPTLGWLTVTNAGPSVPGQPVEVDAKLRSRQALSVALPSISLPAGTLAAIAAVSGVTRYAMDENSTATTNGNGTPSHSIAPVVEGGTDLDVASAIYYNRGLGCGTYGTTTVAVTDAISQIVSNINFYRPTYAPIYVVITAHLLPGGSSATLTAMSDALVTYLNSLQIGELVSYGALVSVAMSVNPNLTLPIVSVRTLFFGTSASPTTTTDVVMAFNAVVQGIAGDISITAV